MKSKKMFAVYHDRKIQTHCETGAPLLYQHELDAQKQVCSVYGCCVREVYVTVSRRKPKGGA